MSEIEAKTGLDFPKYKTIEKRHNTFGTSFNREFSMEYTVQLDTTNIDDFYEQLKIRRNAHAGDKDEKTIDSWDINGEGGYTFRHSDHQEHLFLSIDSSTGKMRVTYGSL